MQVNILEAKKQLSELIRSSLEGKEIIIAKRGVPMARLVPVDTSSSPGTPDASGDSILDWLERHPLPDYARRSHKDIEACLSEERAAWD